jgi:hypothetical protein
MAIIKATYTQRGSAAKASVRYIENRPGKNGGKIQRTLFTGDGRVDRGEVYDMIDQAIKGSYFFRLVISPDPEREGRDKSLDLRVLTDSAMRELEARFRRPLQWVATLHADHAEHRHIHAIAIVPERLQVQDFKQLRSAATAAAYAQLRQLDLAREHQALHQQQEEGLGLSW